MELAALSEYCGIEVAGLALARADGPELGALRDAVHRHGVAVLRDQSLTPEQHIALAERWGHGLD